MFDQSSRMGVAEPFRMCLYKVEDGIADTKEGAIGDCCGWRGPSSPDSLSPKLPLSLPPLATIITNPAGIQRSDGELRYHPRPETSVRPAGPGRR